MKNLLNFFKQPFYKLIFLYLGVFVLFFISYTFIDWLLTTKTRILNINNSTIDLIIPLILGIAVSLIVFRPFLKKLNWGKKAKEIVLNLFIPFTISVPVAFSQQYFRDINYSLIEVDKPADVLKYPGERFFKIHSFFVDSSRCFIIYEKHESGNMGTTLNVSNYTVFPMYTDSSERNKLSVVAFGIPFKTTMSNALLQRKFQAYRIKEFNEKCLMDIMSYDFYEADYFEKQLNTKDADYFKEAWSHNESIDKKATPTILIKKTGTIDRLYQEDQKMVVWSIGICGGLALLVLIIIQYTPKNLFDKVPEEENKEVSGADFDKGY
jgi:hypothetical protein